MKAHSNILTPILIFLFYAYAVAVICYFRKRGVFSALFIGRMEYQSRLQIFRNYLPLFRTYNLGKRCPRLLRRVPFTVFHSSADSLLKIMRKQRIFYSKTTVVILHLGITTVLILPLYVFTICSFSVVV